MKFKRLFSPLNYEDIKELKVKDTVLFSGIIYTARDQAHKRLINSIKDKKPLVIPLKGQLIYYCGPTPSRAKEIIGSCGPTTSSRMEKFTPPLLARGLKGIIGKGRISVYLINTLKKYQAVYFLTYAGCGALLAEYVRAKNKVAYEELGTEAIFKLYVKDFPLIVGVDIKGRCIFDA